MKALFIVIVGLVLVVFGNVVYADTITVPGDHPTIQAAVGAASAGDTVMVAAGIYTENISSMSEVTLHFTVGATTINGLVITGVGSDIISDGDLTIVSVSDITLGGSVTVAGMLGLYADGSIVINGTIDAVEIEMTAGVAINITAPVNGTESVDLQAGSGVTGTDIVTGGSVSIVIEGGVVSIEFSMIYVDDSAVGANDGSSWEDAFNEFYAALNIAEACDKIFVAAGTYLPDMTGLADPREAAFQMKNAVTIKGGYAGYGAAYPDERNAELYETILSGNIGNTNNKSDNCYHVFYHPDGLDLDFTAVLDGFTITSSYADGDNSHDRGGGMYNEGSGPTVTNCIFIANSAGYGSGIYNNGTSSTTVTNCIFTGNSAFRYGGGIYNYSSNLKVIDCTFSKNSADYGAGIYNLFFSKPTVISCSFIGNLASGYGGGMCNWLSRPTVTNCIFSGNSASEGGGIYNYWYSNPTLINSTFSGNLADWGGAVCNSDDSNSTVTGCIFWGNSATFGNEIALKDSSTITIDFCDVQGGQGAIYDDGTGDTIDWGNSNIDVDPIFVDADGADNVAGTGDDDLRLQSGSLCVDAGDNSVVTVVTDLDGNPRIVDGDNDGNAVVDMGAYEFFNTAPVADAGDDILAYAGADGLATVQLDGSGSFDADGDELEYFWLEDANEIATGVDPNVVLAAGVHVIELVVDDGTVSSEPDSVVVTVIEAVEAVAYVFPRVLNVTSRGRYVIARMELPDGISKDDVADDSLVLIIGDTVIESIRQRRISSRGQDYVFGFFDRGRVIAQADGKTKLDIVITGELTTGQCIYGEDSIKIVKSQASQKKTSRRMPVRNNRGGRGSRGRK